MVRAAVGLALILAVFLVGGLVVVQQWWDRWVLRPLRWAPRVVGRKVNDLAESWTRSLVDEANQVIPKVAGDESRPLHPDLVPEALTRFCTSVIRAAPVYAIVLWALTQLNGLTIYHDLLEAFQASSVVPAQGNSSPAVGDPLSSLWHSAIQAAHWLIYDLPHTPASAWLALLPAAVGVSMMAILAWRLGRALGAGSVSGAAQRQGLGRRPVADWSGVAVLIASATACARAHQHWTERPSLDTVPRVSMRAAEKVVRQAYRSRGYRLRSHQRKAAKEHAAKVIGALRADEVALISEPAPALKRLTVKLSTITDRYVEGRVGELLPEVHLAEVTPAPDREVWRWLAVGSVGIALTLGVTFLDVPGEIKNPVMNVAIMLVGIKVLHWGRPSAADALGLFRSGG
ncbi:hypothetical protein [Kitasatospora sp. NPDC001225]